ncbi:hypothetical protein FJR48_07440 [Sulfurimonas lithotrophica]|uniref:SprA-related family protein n=1 Tax=Sulfurimonas lithotrophica TaxID=2590022 RepID=A0A5P8P1P0_9BACT|nr:putative metalloprotease CJM1_0395 family protein [Sulfurimonas lithotrophica]QFR49575.1 hypothetical protein FJR48_07440 [Sulfurimonas lithotrophica]
MQISQGTFDYSTYDYYQNQKEQNTEDKSSDSKKAQNENELSADEKQVVYELQARDTEVRAHEAAHQAAGGGMTGGASYSYQRGPDGKMYAIGGEVSISMPGGSTPQEVIANAQQVIAAALAPANPSAQDMSVASGARAMMVEAQQEKAKETYEEQTQTNEDKEEKDSSIKLDISA